jgi:TonB family protein
MSSSSLSLSSSSPALLCETRWHGRLLAVQRPALNTTVTIAGRSVRAVAGGALVDGVAHVVDQPVVLGSGALSLVLTRALREPTAQQEREFDLVWLQTMMTVVILAVGGLVALWLTPTLPRFDDDLRPGQHLLSHVTVLPPRPPPPKTPATRVAGVKAAASLPAAAAPRAKATTKERRDQDRTAAMDALRALGLTGPAVATASVFGAGNDIDVALSNLNGTGTAGMGVSGLATRGGGGDGTGKNVSLGVLGSGKPGGRGDDSLLTARGGHRGVEVPTNKIVYIGSMSREEIQRVMNRAMSRIRYCYERALTSSPDLEGKLTVLFQIAATGDVASVSKVQSTLTGDVDTCVQRVLQSLKFPTPKGGGVVSVTYPFVFTAH